MVCMCLSFTRPGIDQVCIGIDLLSLLRWKREVILLLRTMMRSKTGRSMAVVRPQRTSIMTCMTEQAKRNSEKTARHGALHRTVVIAFDYS